MLMFAVKHECGGDEGYTRKTVYEVEQKGSCAGCKYLWSNGDGYSDYTWMNTYIQCMQDRNPILEKKEWERPSDWPDDGKDLRNIVRVVDWEPLVNSRCPEYDPTGHHVTVSPDGYVESEWRPDDDQLSLLKARLSSDWEERYEP